jgi:Ferritin-like
MRTIQEFVDNGMTSVADLQDALKLAMQLESSTIPPYLCAQWSVDPATDPAGAVAGMIQTIVVQEMFHFALAGNMLTAIGGVPNVANAQFIPKYPTHKLPGDIDQKLAVDLLPLTTDQLAVFMQIELPEFPPVKFAASRVFVGPQGICCSSHQICVCPRVEFLQNKWKFAFRDTRSGQGNQDPAAHPKDLAEIALLVDRVLFAQQVRQCVPPARVGGDRIHQLRKCCFA